MKRVKQAGRISILTVVAIVCVIACIGVVMFSGQGNGPETTVNGFMSALAESDAKKLASFSFINGEEPDVMERKWNETLTRTKYVQFRWFFDGVEILTAESVTGRIKMQYAGQTEATLNRVPLVKFKDQWKVDVGAINRSFYPSLPR